MGDPKESLAARAKRAAATIRNSPERESEIKEEGAYADLLPTFNEVAASARRRQNAGKARTGKKSKHARLERENERIVKEYIRDGAGDRKIVRMMQERGRKIGRTKVAQIREKSHSVVSSKR